MSFGRYARVSPHKSPFPREIVLLQGTGCPEHCAFCDYPRDGYGASSEKVNRDALDNVVGRYHVLEVINSGSCFELTAQTLCEIRQAVLASAIRELWFEASFRHKSRLATFREFFYGTGALVRFRVGIETFNANHREQLRKTPVEFDVSDCASLFSGCCLLVGIKGQTIKGIVADMCVAHRYFLQVAVNVFCTNSTKVVRDDALVDELMRLWPTLQEEFPNCELHADNTWLGLGEQP
jgi:hypothetical protein